MATVYLALGSNVGDGPAHIAQAIALLGGELQDIVRAPLYVSRAVGYTDQADFTNTALKARTKLAPADLLHFVKDVEAKVGRIARFRWGPREIDIDIILYDDVLMATDKLTIPHPRFAERDFVLRPLLDLDENLIDPQSHKTVQELLDNLPRNEQAIMRRQPDSQN